MEHKEGEGPTPPSALQDSAGGCETSRDGPQEVLNEDGSESGSTQRYQTHSVPPGYPSWYGPRMYHDPHRGIVLQSSFPAPSLSQVAVGKTETFSGAKSEPDRPSNLSDSRDSDYEYVRMRSALKRKRKRKHRTVLIRRRRRFDKDDKKMIKDVDMGNPLDQVGAGLTTNTSEAFQGHVSDHVTPSKVKTSPEAQRPQTHDDDDDDDDDTSDKCESVTGRKMATSVGSPNVSVGSASTRSVRVPIFFQGPHVPSAENRISTQAMWPVVSSNTDDKECTDLWPAYKELSMSTQTQHFDGFDRGSSAVSSKEPTPMVDDSGVQLEVETLVTRVKSSVTTTSNPGPCSSDPGPGSSCLRRPHSAPSLSLVPPAGTLTRARSLPSMLLNTSFKDFTPQMAVDEEEETYWFQCPCPGLYLCSETGLVFHMEGGGDVLYRPVPWNRRLLVQHHKQPAGPLFDIRCVQQSVCQLHLPHCESRSTGGAHFLSVAHVQGEGVEFIAPQTVTETHVVINISGFSAFGNVKDEDSAPVPVRALVLLFYKPPADPDLTSFLNVLLLPRNVVLGDVLRKRKRLDGAERYLETTPYCKLQPEQEYTLSTSPEDQSVLVQPTEAEFDSDNYENFFPSFQLILEDVRKHLNLCLKDVNSRSVWERRVCLSAVKRSCGTDHLSLPPDKRLMDIRSSFVDVISRPVLQSLLDKLLERRVMTDSEREAADVIQDRGDGARSVIDTVRRKGDTASSEMIQVLCELDPFLCEHLGLI